MKEVSEHGDNLVFLLAMPRSGSTLLGLMLGSHPSILCPPEPWFLLKLCSLRDRDLVGASFGDRLATIATREFLDDRVFAESARAFAATAYSLELRGARKSTFVDRTPRYYHVLPKLDQLFPHARWIWLTRDPLDCLASYRSTWGLERSFLRGRPPQPATLDFAQGLFAFEEHFRDPSPRKLRLSYEGLVRSTGETLDGIIRFLGLAPSTEMLDYAKNRPLIERYRASSVGDRICLEKPGVLTDSIGRWRRDLSFADVSAAVALLGIGVFERLGYTETASYIRELGIDIDEAGAAVRRERLRARVSAALEHPRSLPLRIEAWVRRSLRKILRRRQRSEASGLVGPDTRPARGAISDPPG